MDELRIVLLGKQGAGKSASGNTLLRKQSFHTAASSKPVTEACSMNMSTVDKQTIKVIDTPGWCDDSSLFESDVKQEIIKCINMSSPGPHVFLLVLTIGRFTNEEINTVMNILIEFGYEVTKYMIVLFTKGDDLDDRSIEDYLKEVHPDLKKINQLCGERYHVFNNRDNTNGHQVSSLLKKINKMVERNEGKWYTTAMYQKGKNQQMDDRGQQFRTEEDNSVEDKNKNLTESENGDRKNRCDAQGDDGERKSISEDAKEQECCKRKMTQLENNTENSEHEGLKDRKRDLVDKNEDECCTARLEDNLENRKEQDICKGNAIEEQNKSQNREHGGLKQFLISVGKMLELDKERDTLFQERNELQRRLTKKEEEFKQKINNLELQKQEVNQYEINKLIQEVDKQNQVIERLQQDIKELKKMYGLPERCSDGRNVDQAINNK